MTARLRYLEDRADGATRAAVMAALQPRTREILSRPIDVKAWVPFEAFVDVNVALDRVLGIGDLELCFEIGRFSADLQAARYRAELSLESMPFMHRRAAGMWSDHYDSGTLDVVTADEKATTMRIIGFETPHRAHCRSVAGWIGRITELAGTRIESQVERVCASLGGPWCEIGITYR